MKNTKKTEKVVVNNTMKKTMKKTAVSKTAVTKKNTQKKTAKCAKNNAHKIGLFNIKTGKKSRVFKTQTAAAEFIGVNSCNISRALRGIHAKCKNYIVKYVD